MHRPPALTDRTLAALLGVLALSACGPAQKPAATPAPASPPQAPAVAPTAPTAEDLAAANALAAGKPNFRVCLSSSLDKPGEPPLTLPAGVIFISWGKRRGDERNPALDADMLAPGAVRWVVVTNTPLTLSSATPCAETTARTATSEMFEWRMPLVRHGQDLQFQVTGVENHMAFPLTNRLGELVKKGLVFGYPTADIGHPRALKEEG